MSTKVCHLERQFGQAAGQNLTLFSTSHRPPAGDHLPHKHSNLRPRSWNEQDIARVNARPVAMVTTSSIEPSAACTFQCDASICVKVAPAAAVPYPTN